MVTAVGWGWIPAAVGRFQHLQKHHVREEEDGLLTCGSSKLTFDVHPELSRHGFDSGEAGQASPPKAASCLGWK